MLSSFNRWKRICTHKCFLGHLRLFPIQPSTYYTWFKKWKKQLYFCFQSLRCLRFAPDLLSVALLHLLDWDAKYFWKCPLFSKCFLQNIFQVFPTGILPGIPTLIDYSIVHKRKIKELFVACAVKPFFSPQYWGGSCYSRHLLQHNLNSYGSYSY